MRRLSARYAGVCVGCGSSFGRGAEVWYVPEARGRGVCYCGECGGQYARDIAADDDDMATMYFGRG